MPDFFNSRWFNLAKGTILAIAAFLMQQETAAEIAKAKNEPVVTWDLPNGVIPALTFIYGALQVGQKPKP